MTKKLLLLDLDRTLLDTQRFIPDLWAHLADRYKANDGYEISRIPHWYRAMGGLHYYDLKLHIEESLGAPADEAVAAVTPELLKRDYAFSDVSELAAWRRNPDYEIGILTFGSVWTQQFKLRCIPAIADLPCHIVLESKGEFVTRHYAGRQGFLVDDRRNAGLPPGIREVWLDRDGTNRHPEGIITINSLTELGEVL